MAVFGKTNKESTLSIPISDDSEARWRREDFLPLSFSSPLWGSTEGELAIDVYATDHTVVVRTTMAGVSPEDVHIALHNDLLTIRGERREDETVRDDQYVVQECHWGSFSRSVVLPVPVSSEGVQAIMKNGVLKIVLRRVSPTHVEVKVLDESAS